MSRCRSRKIREARYGAELVHEVKISTPTPTRMTLEALRLAVHKPSTWLILSILVSAAPAVVTAGALGIHADGRHNAALFYDVAFTAIVLGAACGVASLARMSKFAAHASGSPSWVARIAVISSLSGLHAVGTAVPVLLLGIPVHIVKYLFFPL